MFDRKRRDLRGQKCFLTGAASGIGRATALAAAARGADLFLTDLDAIGLARVVADVRAAGGTVREARALDLTSYEAVASFARAIHETHGSMDVVMNIAGIAVWGTVEELEHAQWRKVIEVNLMGPIHVIECFVPPMIGAGRGGHLVNVSSAAGLFGLPWHAAYSASKFGLRGVSEVLRFDLARHGIGVSLVCPGGVDTPIVQSVNIRGIDVSHPAVERMRTRFQKHAVTPEVAAAAILRGIERGETMVFTSRDIQVGYWFQRKFALPYELVMRLMNHQFHRLKVVASNGAAADRGAAPQSDQRM